MCLAFTRTVSLGFFHNWEPRRFFMLWSVHLDEAGTHDQSPIMAMGGFLATAEQWEAFDNAWRECLASFNLPYSHCVELTGRRGPFKGWGVARHNDFILSTHQLL